MQPICQQFIQIVLEMKEVGHLLVIIRLHGLLMMDYCLCLVDFLVLVLVIDHSI